MTEQYTSAFDWLKRVGVSHTRFHVCAYCVIDIIRIAVILEQSTNCHVTLQTVAAVIAGDRPRENVFRVFARALRITCGDELART